MRNIPLWRTVTATAPLHCKQTQVTEVITENYGHTGNTILPLTRPVKYAAYAQGFENLVEIVTDVETLIRAVDVEVAYRWTLRETGVTRR